MNTAGTAVDSSTRSRFTSRTSCTSVPLLRRRSSTSLTVLCFGPASAMSSSSELSALTGWLSTAISSSPGRMSALDACEPGAVPITTNDPPSLSKFTGTGYSLPARNAFSFSALNRTAVTTHECGSCACTMPRIAAMINSCVSTESGWLTRIWLSTPENI